MINFKMENRQKKEEEKKSILKLPNKMYVN